MPIVSIQIVGELTPSPDEKKQLQNLTNILGNIFNSAPGATWVKITSLGTEHYAENDIAVSDLVQPVFVEVLKRSLQDRRMLAGEAQKIAISVAQELRRPVENIHVLYLPAGEGRIAFGGKL